MWCPPWQPINCCGGQPQPGIVNPGRGTPVSVPDLPVPMAQIKVHVPNGATVYANGQLMRQTGPVRTFETPEIAHGRDHHYTLKVEAVVNGEARVASRRVTVRAGWASNVDFRSMANDKATSAVTVNLPAAAKLLVEGKEAAAAVVTSGFNTPELPVGQEVTYTFQTETPRDGRTEVETRRVTFKAGDPVLIDFSRKATDSVVTLK